MALDSFVLALGLVFVVLCFILLGIQYKGWRWAREIERDLRGQEGGELAKIILIIATAALASQTVVCLAVLLSAIDRDSTTLLRLVLIVFSQFVLTVAFVSAMRRARTLDRLPPNDDGDPPAADGRERAEGVGVQVDEVGAGPAVAVDHADTYAPI